MLCINYQSINYISLLFDTQMKHQLIMIYSDIRYTRCDAKYISLLLVSVSYLVKLSNTRKRFRIETIVLQFKYTLPWSVITYIILYKILFILFLKGDLCNRYEHFMCIYLIECQRYQNVASLFFTYKHFHVCWYENKSKNMKRSHIIFLQDILFSFTGSTDSKSKITI